MTGFTTDKVEPHQYFTDYLALAAKLPRDAAVCEIGIEHGASLVMWQHLFPHGVVIGVDHSVEAPQPEGTHKVTCDQADPALPGLVREHAPGGCDLIVDDASHIGHKSRETFALLWPVVKPGGYFVLEDWADPWVFPSWVRWPDIRPELAGDELIDYVPEMITALKDGAVTVTYTWQGLVIIQKAP